MLTNLHPAAEATGRLLDIQLYRWDLGENINAYHEAKQIENVRIWAAATSGILERLYLDFSMLGGMAGEW